MRAMIRNFMAIKRADLDLTGITLLAANNAAGKTSTTKALAAVLTGQVIPYQELAKKDAKELLTAGTAEGVIYLETLEGKARIDYPAAVRKVEGTMPVCSPVAAGLTSLLEVPAADKVQAVSEMLGLELLPEDVEPSLIELGCTKAEQAAVLMDLQALGSDSAAVQAKERGTKAKGQWEALTGENWGKVQAARWKPSSWTIEMGDWTEEFAKEQLVEAKRKYEDMLKIEALTELEQAQLQEQAQLKDARTLAYNLAVTSYKEAAENVEEAKKQQESHKVVTQVDRSEPCPNCGVHLLRKEKLEIATGDRPTPQQLEESLKVARELAAQFTSYTLLRDNAHQEMNEAAALLNQSLNAEKKLAAIKTVVAEKPDVEGARQNMALAEKRLKDYQLKHQADDAYAAACRLVKVADLLKPTGLKAEKLGKLLKALNERLVRLATAANWKFLVLKPDLTLQYGAQPYWKLSASEKFRARVLLQAVTATYDGSQFLVIDGIDILDKDGRNGLMKLLQHTGLPALVTATMSSGKDPIPDLAAAKLGRTYLLKEGIAEPFGILEEKKTA